MHEEFFCEVPPNLSSICRYYCLSSNPFQSFGGQRIPPQPQWALALPRSSSPAHFTERLLRTKMGQGSWIAGAAVWLALGCLPAWLSGEELELHRQQVS